MTEAKRHISFSAKVFWLKTKERMTKARQEPHQALMAASTKVGEEWVTAQLIDKRGLYLSQGLWAFTLWGLVQLLAWKSDIKDETEQILFSMVKFVLVGVEVCFWPLYLRKIRQLSYLKRRGFFPFVIAFVIALLFARSLTFGYAEGVTAVAVHFIIIVAILKATFINAEGAIALYASSLVAAVATIIFSIIFVVIDPRVAGFANPGYAIIIATLVVVVAIILSDYLSTLVIKDILRVQEIQKRVVTQESWSLSRERFESIEEKHTVRQHCAENCLQMIQQHLHAAIGMAGRRGVGKTNLLQSIQQKIGSLSPQHPLREESSLRDKEKVNSARIRNVQLFVRTPSDFEEMSILTALLEQIATKINLQLTNLLLAIKPNVVERVLDEKRRALRWLHRRYVVVALALLGLVGWQYLKSDIDDPWLKSISFIGSNLGLQNGHAQHSTLYLAKRDSLTKKLEPVIRAADDSTNRINKLLNPPALRGFSVSAYWDSLQRSLSQPQLEALDSLLLEIEHAQRQLDSIAEIERQHFAMQETLSVAKRKFGAAKTTWLVRASFYLGGIGFPIALLVIWFRTSEGKGRLTSKVYDSVRNEIALYHRTNALLDRLHYHMTYSDSKEAGVAASPFWGWLNFSGRRSQQTSREMRPFTLISLVEEYRQYLREVVHHLNEALRESGIEGQVKIIIAIDELDKVLNHQRLNELLKSMKAVFELKNVYYILSISEDALETYRLRHVETKNEIDSAFTHIFSVPPMDATASLDFFVTPKPSWSPLLLPAAIVFGGGVPRDMHRLAQLMGIHWEWTTLKKGLDALRCEDINAAIDFVKLNSNLSDEWRHRFVESLRKLEKDGTAVVEQQMSEVEEMNFEEFLRENPATEEVAKKKFHHLRSVVRGMIIKAYIYHRVEQLPVPVELQSWFEAKPEEHHEWPKEGDAWLKQLNELRDGIFDLASDPLGVWERLRSLK